MQKFVFKSVRLPNYCPVIKNGYDGNQALGIPATPAIRAKFTDGSYSTYDEGIAELLRNSPRYGIEFLEDETNSVKAPKTPGPNYTSISFDGNSPVKSGGTPKADIKEMIVSEAARIAGEIVQKKLQEQEDRLRAEFAAEKARISDKPVVGKVDTEEVDIVTSGYAATGYIGDDAPEVTVADEGTQFSIPKREELESDLNSEESLTPPVIEHKQKKK
ncbi:MAG: hypothetical protein WC455_10695 [Dehalococcoidia bacterium]|jgi:hypothetical protein